MPARLYLPAAGTPAASPAFDSSWEVSAAADRLPMVRTISNTSRVGILRTKTSATASIDTLIRQYVSTDTLPAKSIAGTVKLVVVGSESALSANAFPQMVIRVVSGDGSTVRGTLYAGQTATVESATSTDPNYEFLAPPNDEARILDVSLTPVTAQAGDRLVVEIGYRANNTLTTRSVTTYFGDPTAATDYSGAVGQALSASLRPWIEFSLDPFAAAAVQVKTFAGAPLKVWSGGTLYNVVLAS